MVRTPVPGLIEDDSPELTDAELPEMRPGEILPPALYHTLTRGRPKKPDRKVAIKLARSDIIAAFRATGEGWQTRINDVLRRAVKTLRSPMTVALDERDEQHCRKFAPKPAVSPTRPLGRHGWRYTQFTHSNDAQGLGTQRPAPSSIRKNRQSAFLVGGQSVTKKN